MEPHRAGRKARYKPIRHAPEEETSDPDPLDEEPPRKRGRIAPVKTTTTRYGRTSKAVQEPIVTQITGRAGKRTKLSSPPLETAPARGRSTRANRRSGIVGDQWEPIPEEWLNPDTAGKAANGKGKKGKKPTQEDEESELSELSDVAGEDESDLTSISSSGWSDVEGDDVQMDETQAASLGHGKEGGAGEEGLQSGGTVPMETEKIESLDVAPVNGPDDDTTPMDIDQPAALLPSDAQPSLDSTIDAPDSAVDPGNNVSVDVSGASQDNAMVSGTTAEEPNPVAEQIGEDISMEVVASEDVGQALDGGELAVEGGKVAVDGVQSTEVQGEPDASTTAEDQLPSPKEEPESIPPLQQEPATAAPMTDIAVGQKANGIEAKTVLQQLSEEVAEALEEEEADPNDEVRAIIKRARNPDYLEWELVSPFALTCDLTPSDFVRLDFRSVHLVTNGNNSPSSLRTRAMRTRRHSTVIS